MGIVLIRTGFNSDSRPPHSRIYRGIYRAAPARFALLHPRHLGSWWCYSLLVSLLSFFLLIRGRTLCILSLHPAGGCRAGARGFGVCFAFGLRLGCGFGFGFGFGAWFSNFVCRWGVVVMGRVFGSIELGVLI
jgi:hypothetical protein